MDASGVDIFWGAFCLLREEEFDRFTFLFLCGMYTL